MDRRPRRYADQAHVVDCTPATGPHRMDEEAIRIFADAVQTCGLPNDRELRQTLKDFWAWSMRSRLNAYPDSADDVPADLTIPRWDWNGPVEEQG